MWHLHPFDHETISMGLHPLDMEHWIEIDDRYEEYHQEKLRLLRSHHDDVSVALSGSENAQQALFFFLIEHLHQHHPKHFRLTGTGHIENRLTGQKISLYDNEFSYLERASLLVQEDLVLIRGDQMVAGCVCLPSGWSPKEKIGCSMAEIHAPVAGYGKIEKSVDVFLSQARKPVWRANWGIRGHCRLYVVDTREGDLWRPGDDPGASLYLLTEKGCIFDLPGTKTKVFSIRVWTQPLTCLQQEPSQAIELYRLLEEIPEDLAEYKGLTDYRETVMSWMRANIVMPDNV